MTTIQFKGEEVSRTVDVGTIHEFLAKQGMIAAVVTPEGGIAIPDGRHEMPGDVVEFTVKEAA